MGRGIAYQTKRNIAEWALGQTLGFLGRNPDKRSKYLMMAIDRLASGERQITIRNWINAWLEEGKPGREFLRRIGKNTHSNVRRRFVARTIISWFFRDRKLAAQVIQEHGVTLPYTMLISPTMRCNYHCQGCYAASYTRNDDMNPEVFDRVLCEAENMGMRFFTVLGGEPFLYPDLLDILRKHRRSAFQVFTNGSMLDKVMAKKLVEMGNIAPQISVNGPGEYTDSTRGKGAFQQVMRAMDNLREAGCLFGFSSLLTRDNAEVLCSEDWIDLMIEKGAVYGWLFMYMPVGGDNDIDLMPTPEQRNILRVALRGFRRTKPILPVDFWSDGTLTGGCIAGGRLYFHINHHGDVEPCIFCHFATHNINDCTLIEALRSPFFMGIKDSQPFNYNTLRPCPMIDHPQAMWHLIQEHGAWPTHDGAEDIFTRLAPQMEDYSARVQEMMDEVWEQDDYHDWAARWSSNCGIPPLRLEARRREFEESKGKKRNLVTV